MIEFEDKNNIISIEEIFSSQNSFESISKDRCCDISEWIDVCMMASELSPHNPSYDLRDSLQSFHENKAKEDAGEGYDIESTFLYV